MPITTRWYDEEKTIQILEYADNWTWDELYLSQRESCQMGEAVGHPFALIQDMSRFRRLPPNALAHGRPLVQGMSPYIYLNVFVGMTPFVQSIWGAFASVYKLLVPKQRFMYAKTIQEALEIIKKNPAPTA